jgi:WD40 repeat protein
VLEAGLPPDTGANSSDSVTIESILQEKKAYDNSLNFEKLGLDDSDRGWSEGAPSEPTIISSLPSRSNILSVSVVELCLRVSAQPQVYIAVTTADRKLHLLDSTSPAYEVAHSYSDLTDSPILDMLVLSQQLILVASMSGRLSLYDTVQSEALDERKDHSKYIVKLACHRLEDTILIASAGWDSKVFLYTIKPNETTVQLGKPSAVLTLPTIPETLVFIESPDDGSPLLVVTRRDSTFLHFYAVPCSDSQDLNFLGRQNLAPHSNAWIAFSASDVQVCPTDPSLVAVATSTTPYMKLLILKLLVPTKQSSLLAATPVPGPDGTVTQASQARAELLIQDREEAAIIVNVSTLAPQTQYSTPRLVWRPDGSGVYVSSDDGLVRGIEATTGKVTAAMEGHDPGSKLRCLWAGTLQTPQDSEADLSTGQEYLISGGFDQKLIVWHA